MGAGKRKGIMKVHLYYMDEETLEFLQEEVAHPHLQEVVFDLDSGQRFRVRQDPKGDQLLIKNPDGLQIVVVPEAFNKIAVTVREDKTNKETGAVTVRAVREDETNKETGESGEG